MQTLCFITGNAHKLREAQTFLPQIVGWELDLPEIQHSEPQPVIEAKLLSALALANQRKAFLVEDTGLYLKALKGLPGPLIKWFIGPEKLGLKGLYELASSLGNTQAEAISVIGFLNKNAEGLVIQYFEGKIQGNIVSPRGEKGFGWDAVFQPLGSTQTFAEMSEAEKASFSMRGIAFTQLKKYLLDFAD
jgi:inosine triphosphate pyrophosphatase